MLMYKRYRIGKVKSTVILEILLLSFLIHFSYTGCNLFRYFPCNTFTIQLSNCLQQANCGEQFHHKNIIAVSRVHLNKKLTGYRYLKFHISTRNQNGMKEITKSSSDKNIVPKICMTTLILHVDDVCYKHYKICPTMHQAKALSEFF